MADKGFFITFEGGEGSGKSSLIESLASFFLENHLPYLKTREPGGTPLSEEIRSLILEKEMSNFTELALYLAARSEHVDKVILPALMAKKLVLCDRFNDSTTAYQGYGRGLDLKMIKKLCAFFSQDLIPDITFYLDLDPKIGLKRASHRELDRLEREKIDFHQKIRKAFLKMAKQEQRFFVIDASISKEEVLQKALFHLRQKHVV